VLDFQKALDLLSDWRFDESRWARRMVGVAAHFWAKRSRGEKECKPDAQKLIEFLSPLFVEWETDAVKGVAWGFKSLGRTYPDLIAAWLEKKFVEERPRYRAIMLRKTMKFLPDKDKMQIEKILKT
jgi:hypothetical protein